MSQTKLGNCPVPSNYEEYLVKPVKVVGPFTTQNLLFLIAIGSAGIATTISLFLIMKHLHRYTEPKQQRQIVRIIFTPVVFSVVSALSILNYNAAKYIQPLVDLYEAFGLASLFLLYVEYVAPDPHTRQAFFAALENRKPKSKFNSKKGYKVIPGGSLQWYQRGFVGVFLYAFIDILMTIVQIVTQALDDYCYNSWNPKYAHIWIFLVTNFFLGWAIDSVFTFYGRMRKEPDFAGHHPGLKIISFKVIIFINFIQSIVFSSISVHVDSRFTERDLRLGLPYALMAVEQIFFAIFFHYSFRSREYHETMKTDMVTPRMGTLRACANAFNPTDLIIGMYTAVTRFSMFLIGKITGRGQQNPQVGPSRVYDSNSSHLEPMTQQYAPPSYRPDSPYRAQQADIRVSPPQEMDQGYGYNSGYTSVAQPPQASFGRDQRDSSPMRYGGEEYSVAGEESDRLNTRVYNSHSRGSKR